MNWLSFVYAIILGLVISFIGGFLDFPEPLVSFSSLSLLRTSLYIRYSDYIGE